MIDNKELSQKIEYIHYNPVKENYCSEMRDWLYSSARYYETGEDGVIEVQRII